MPRRRRHIRGSCRPGSRSSTAGARWTSARTRRRGRGMPGSGHHCSLLLLACSDHPLMSGFLALGSRTSYRDSSCKRAMLRRDVEAQCAAYRERAHAKLTGMPRLADHVLSLQSPGKSSLIDDSTLISTIHAPIFAILSSGTGVSRYRPDGRTDVGADASIFAIEIFCRFLLRVCCFFRLLST